MGERGEQSLEREVTEIFTKQTTNNTETRTLEDELNLNVT